MWLSVAELLLLSFLGCYALFCVFATVHTGLTVDFFLTRLVPLSATTKCSSPIYW